MTQKDLFQKDQISSPLISVSTIFSRGKSQRARRPRHIFPYIFRIVEQTRPSYVIYENVYGHLSLGLDEVLFKWKASTTVQGHLYFRLHQSEHGYKKDRLWIICKSLRNTEHDGSSSSRVQKQRRKCKKVTERDGRNRAI